jgi:hypothetical protein
VDRVAQRRTPASTTTRAGEVTVIACGDFNCPYLYLANVRVNALLDAGLGEVEFRAVEHDGRLARVTRRPTAADDTRWRRELAEVDSLARPGEPVPAGVPAVLPNTRSAVSAYAESVTEWIHRSLRNRLFDAIWVERRNTSNAYEVRQSSPT